MSSNKSYPGLSIENSIDFKAHHGGMRATFVTGSSDH
jgi:hypothetical protein